MEPIDFKPKWPIELDDESEEILKGCPLIGDNTDDMLDEVYDVVDNMILKSDFSALNSLIEELVVKELSADKMLGFLTATLSVKSKLPARIKFFDDIKQELTIRGEYEEGILAGLN